MESIGDKLRNEREQKGYSIEQIARDTNIAKRYLEALEAEDFSTFPGDPYLIGFLRNYSDYLGIDPDEMVTLYKNFQIQSQPVPMDELIVKRDRKPLIIGIIAAVVVIALGVGGYFLVPEIVNNIKVRQAQRESSVSEESTGGSVYTLDGEMIERRFFEKDVVEIPHKDQVFEIQLADIGDRLNLAVPGGTMQLRVGDERAVDLDGDANMDITVAVNDIYSDADPKSAVLRFDLFVKSTSGVTTQPESRPVDTVGVNTPVLESRLIEPVVITEAGDAEAFSVNISFKGYCLFRYLIDNRDREERYFERGDTIILEVTNEVALWMSNGGNVSARVEGRDLDLGRPGEVSTRIIGWTEGGQEGNSRLLLQAFY